MKKRSKKRRKSTISKKRQQSTMRLLAILTIVNGALGFLGLALINSAGDASLETSVPTMFLFVPIFFFGLLSFAAGTGMWTGRPWGWWLAIYYYLAAALGSLTGVSGALMPEVSTSALFRYGWKLIFGVALVIYLNIEDSRKYFAVSHLSKWKPLLILLAAAIGTQAIFLGLMLISLR